MRHVERAYLFGYKTSHFILALIWYVLMRESKSILITVGKFQFLHFCSEF